MGPIIFYIFLGFTTDLPEGGYYAFCSLVDRSPLKKEVTLPDDRSRTLIVGAEGVRYPVGVLGTLVINTKGYDGLGLA